MGSLKPSVRSKGVVRELANGNGHALGSDARSEVMQVFESEIYDADSYVQSRCKSMSEKGIRALCSELMKLKKASAEEMKRSVYANYSAFIRTSKEISDLECEILTMQNLLSDHASLIHGFVEDVQLICLPDGSGAAAKETEQHSNHRALSEGEKRMHALLDNLDVLIAERRIDEALTALFEGEKLVSGSTTKDDTTMTGFLILISERRAILRGLLIEIVLQPSTRGSELRTVVSALYKLGDGPCAHTSLLSAHSQKLQNNMQGLRAHGTAYSRAYTTALSQLVFSTISQAVKDSQSVFGAHAPYASELVLWASEETTKFASLIKRHVLSCAVAVAGGLRAAADCVQVALGYCSLLEAQGLTLCPALLKLFRPNVEEALQSNFRHIEQSVSLHAAADDWIVYSISGTGHRSRNQITGGLTTQYKISSSAHKFQTLIQDFFDDVTPLVQLQLSGLLLDGLDKLFESYIEHLMMAVPGPVDEGLGARIDHKVVKPAETESQQLGLLANVYAFAEEILPRALMRVLPVHSFGSKEQLHRRGPEKPNAELREWKRRWQRMADKLRDHYCMQQVLNLIFPEDGDANFSIYSYLDLDYGGSNDNGSSSLECSPSQLFQQLFSKLNKLHQIAADVLAGRDRMTAMLLTRIVETFVILISDHQDFWDEMENGMKPLGQLGLQQFVLDMQFVIQIALYGRYLSRQARTIVSDIIARAFEAFSRNGIDPNSILPEDDWFTATAQSSLYKLLEMSRGESGSPTASISAQSMSSTRSLGSP